LLLIIAVKKILDIFSSFDYCQRVFPRICFFPCSYQKLTVPYKRRQTKKCHSCLLPSCVACFPTSPVLHLKCLSRHIFLQCLQIYTCLPGLHVPETGPLSVSPVCPALISVLLCLPVLTYPAYFLCFLPLSCILFCLPIRIVFLHALPVVLFLPALPVLPDASCLPIVHRPS
jgi:hypothetical protein